MKDILDPAGFWLGRPPLALAAGNKRPVVGDDALVIVMNSGPVSVDVLANDYDPEGQPLSIVAANAALGTAVVETNNTVSYTPPAGISGFDTVVYTAADDLGQERQGQINVSIVEPQLSITTTPENTLIITAETGQIDITVTSPAAFAGTYQVDTAALIGGPVNLVPPTVSGTVENGQTLLAEPGLWVHDLSAGPIIRSWQWKLAGTDIPGATGETYPVQAGDVGQAISVMETQSDANGQRMSESAPLGAAFLPSDDPELIAWWDADDAATLIASGISVSSWASKAGPQQMVQGYAPERPSTGVRTLNGRNVLDFDGSKTMETALSLPASGNVAFHLVLEIDGSSNAFAAVLGIDATNDFQIDASDPAAFLGRLNMAGIGSSVGLTGGPFSGPVILSAVFDLSGTSTAEVHIANSLRGVTAYTLPIDPAVVMSLMTNRSQNANVDGAIGEVIVTESVTNRAAYHSYLAEKWGLI